MIHFHSYALILPTLVNTHIHNIYDADHCGDDDDDGDGDALNIFSVL